MLLWLHPRFIATLMGLLSLATTAWSALVSTQTTSIQPAQTLTPEQFAEGFIFIVQHYAGTVYTDPSFEGNTALLFENGCTNLTVKIASLKLQHSENTTAACSFYRSSGCSGDRILASTEDPSFQFKNEEMNSYECELVRPTKVPSQYAGIVYVDPDFKGETQWLIAERGCVDLTGTFDATVSSYKVQTGGNQVARCSFYDAYGCGGSLIIITPADGLEVPLLEGAKDNKARSYRCSLYPLMQEG